MRVPGNALGSNAEARFRAGATLGWRVALFLLSLLVGALAWQVVLQPAWQAASLRAGLGPELEALAYRVLEEALEASPAILIALAAWDAASILRRFSHGDGRLAVHAGSIRHMGVALFLAGAMALLGRPSLLASLHAAEPALRIAFTAEGLSLAVLGLVASIAGRTLRDGG